MILMDSSGWVEIAGGGPRKGTFTDAIEAAQGTIVPTIVVREVYRAVERQAGAPAARQLVRYLATLTVVPLDLDLAVLAAEVARDLRLALADSIVYATAQAHGARLVTGDADFASLAEVEYVPTPSP